MKQIMAIGGGGFGSYTSELIMERYILAQTKQPNPKIAFLPQASAEDPRYVVAFMDAFRLLGADPSWLSLFGRVKPNWPEQLLQQINEQNSSSSMGKCIKSNKTSLLKVYSNKKLFGRTVNMCYQV